MYYTYDLFFNLKSKKILEYSQKEILRSKKFKVADFRIKS